MILGPVSLVDCAVFCLALAPQLLIHVGLIPTVWVVIQALPYLLLRMPYQFIEERYFRSPARQSAFVRGATAFEDIIIRCVRYAFKYIPCTVGRVFLSKWVALPFVRWRMLRHGYIVPPVAWREYTIEDEEESHIRGVWITHRAEIPPDFVMLYAHGGGFSMGSCYFYLEFLMTWHHMLLEVGFENPAIFALEYSLAPDEKYPRQVTEMVRGYRHVLDYAQDASKVCVAGDSAGAALVLSLLQAIGGKPTKGKANGSVAGSEGLPVPRMATLISPWVTLRSGLHYPSEVDFLDRQTLWKYAEDYTGSARLHQWPASPGSCTDQDVWRAASPQRGYFVTYGEEEVLAPDIEDFLARQERAGVEVRSLKFAGGLHAWTVASLFLSSAKDKRLEGLKTTVTEVRRRFARNKGEEM